jgi:hypothetical protein
MEWPKGRWRVACLVVVLATAIIAVSALVWGGDAGEDEPSGAATASTEVTSTEAEP